VIKVEIESIRKKRLRELKERMKYPDGPIKVTDETIDEVKKKYPICVIDCWAPWCMPCNILAPTIEKLAKKYRGKIVFGKLNIDENKNTAIKYKIMSIPTLLVFRNAELVDRIIGALPYEILDSKMKKILEK
jgi:thioredoxin 1